MFNSMSILATAKGDIVVAMFCLGAGDILSGEHLGKSLRSIDEHPAYKEAVADEEKARAIAKDLLR